MDCFSGSAAFIALAGAVILAFSAFLRSKEVKRSEAALRVEVERLRHLVVRLEMRVHDLEAGRPPSEAAAIPVPAPPAPEPVSELIRQPIREPVAQPVVVPPEPVRPPQPPPMPPPLKPAQSLEEKLGARLPVWIGSIALALAGAFLVKYSFERGWLSPALRVSMGVLFGVGLLAAGEVTRRNRSTGGISQGLSAAGIADLFACFLAGIHLYGIIPPPLGFGLMVLTTAVAVGLSLRQGKMVALIGLIGGFLTPYLVRTGEPNVRGLFAYLLLLQVGLLVVAWKRGWAEIAGLALGGGLLWTFAWLARPFKPADAAWLGGFVMLSAASVVAAGLSRRAQAQEAGPPGVSAGSLSGLTWAAVPAAILAMAVVANQAGFATEEWVFFGILAAGVLVLARLRPELHTLSWVAAVAAVVLFGAWALEVQPPDLERFVGTAVGLGLLFAGGGYAALWGSKRAGQWASLSVASGLAFFLISWSRLNLQWRWIPWGSWALALAVASLAAAVPLAQRRRARPDLPELSAALAAFAVAVTTYVSLAVPLELERQWLTVAWALEVAALVWLAGRFKLPVLSTLARLLAAMVAVRLLLNASVLDYPIGAHPVFNWLVYGYGLPLLAFAAAAWLARRQAQENPEAERFATLLEAGALAFAFVLVTLEVRQLYHPGRPGSGDPGLAESAALVAAWAVLGAGLLVANRRALLRSVEQGGRIVLALSALAALALPCLALNPLWEHTAVGETKVFNLLLWDYGLPSILLAATTLELRRRGSWKLPVALTTTSLILVFLLVTLEIRQAFHGTYLDVGESTVAERYAYSAAWILFGTALLAAGIATKGKALRYASLAVMLLSVGKVFLYDTSNLSDLYRVFSFLGLGVSLLALAWVYQRFVFRESA